MDRKIYDMIVKYEEEGLTDKELIQMYQAIYDYNIRINYSMSVELEELISSGYIKTDKKIID